MRKRVFTSGQTAVRVAMPRWRLQYLIERKMLPGPSFQVPGRRLFTLADIDNIVQVLEQHPELRKGR